MFTMVISITSLNSTILLLTSSVFDRQYSFTVAQLSAISLWVNTIFIKFWFWYYDLINIFTFLIMSMRNLKAGLGVTDQLLDVVVLLEHVRTKLLVLVVQSFHLVIKKMVRIVVMPMLRTLGQGSFAVTNLDIDSIGLWYLLFKNGIVAFDLFLVHLRWWGLSSKLWRPNGCECLSRQNLNAWVESDKGFTVLLLLLLQRVWS